MEKKRKQTSKGSAGYLCVRMLECSLPNKVFFEYCYRTYPFGKFSLASYIQRYDAIYIKSMYRIFFLV